MKNENIFFLYQYRLINDVSKSILRFKKIYIHFTLRFISQQQFILRFKA